MNKKIFSYILLFFSLSLFVACSDDDDDKVDNTDYSTEVKGTYKGDINIKIPSMQFDQTSLRKIILSSEGFNKVKLELKDFSFPIDGVNEVPVGDIVVNEVPLVKNGDIINLTETKTAVKLLNGQINADVTVSGTIKGKNLVLDIDVKVAEPIGSVIVAFNGDKMDADNENTEALIKSMTIDSPVIAGQPTISGTSISFYVAEDATADDLKELIPVMEISEKATVTPASGSKVDFSQGAVQFTVVAEDGIHKTVYTATYLKMGKYGFEEWGVDPGLDPTNLEPQNIYYAPVGGWSSSNGGAHLIKVLFQMTDKYPVTQSNEAYGGKSAVKIETIDTKGADKVFAKIPKVTTGTLFLGNFSADLMNTLKSTKFGVLSTKKPVEVRGYYKYAPGEKFYRATGMNDCHLAKEEAGTVDECAINAILYEYEKESDYLTGADAYTSDKLVAIAQLEDGTAKSEYTSFSIQMDYLKDYDPNKKYRFAIICSSSRYGDTFSGAPGSVLIVDELEVIYE